MLHHGGHMVGFRTPTGSVIRQGEDLIARSPYRVTLVVGNQDPTSLALAAYRLTG